MSETRVVNFHIEPADVNVGRRTRPLHYGNPFSHKPDSIATVIVATREESIKCFDEWLSGKAWHEVEPERRDWILETLPKLRGKSLGCWCSPLPCHADRYKQMLDAGYGQLVSDLSVLRTTYQDLTSWYPSFIWYPVIEFVYGGRQIRTKSGVAWVGGEVLARVGYGYRKVNDKFPKVGSYFNATALPQKTLYAAARKAIATRLHGK